MKSEAIRCAIKLYVEPTLLARFNDPYRKLPRGITELLRLVSSEAALTRISKNNNIKPDRFKAILINYIQSVLLQEHNSNFRKLGLDHGEDELLCKRHYKLLINIFHPDKSKGNIDPRYSHIIAHAYRNLKEKQKASQQISAQRKKITSNTRSHTLATPLASMTMRSKLSKMKRDTQKYRLIQIALAVSLFVVASTGMLLLDSSEQHIVRKNISAQHQNATNQSKKSRNTSSAQPVGMKQSHPDTSQLLTYLNE